MVLLTVPLRRGCSGPERAVKLIVTAEAFELLPVLKLICSSRACDASTGVLIHHLSRSNFPYFHQSFHRPKRASGTCALSHRPRPRIHSPPQGSHSRKSSQLQHSTSMSRRVIFR